MQDDGNAILPDSALLRGRRQENERAEQRGEERAEEVAAHDNASFISLFGGDLPVGGTQASRSVR